MMDIICMYIYLFNRVFQIKNISRYKSIRNRSIFVHKYTRFNLNIVAQVFVEGVNIMPAIEKKNSYR